MKKNKLSKRHLKLICEYIDEAREELLMGDWDIDYKVVKERSNENYFMEMVSDPKYVRATLKIYEPNVLEELETMKDDELRNAVYHEIIHALLSPLTQLANARYITVSEFSEENERVTERLAKIITGYKRQLA